MKDMTKYLVIVLGVFVAGLLFSFSIEPGLVAVAANEKKLRDGHADLVFGFPYPDATSLDIPAGVVLTDLVLRGARVGHVSSPECHVHLVGFNPTTRGEETLFRYFVPIHNEAEAAPPLTELHLESGLRSSENRRIQVRSITEYCSIAVFWTGYEE